ncbi:MAG: type 1 glutamine amidotransferase domain-containing protein [Opitutales bacterium]
MNEIALTVLFILTSHGQLGDTGKPTGLWLEEATTPYYAMTDAGVRVVIATPDGQPVPIDPRSLNERGRSESVLRYLREGDLRAALAQPETLGQLDLSGFDGLFFPGGHGPMFDLADSETVGDAIAAFVDADKPVGAVCHGPAALLPAKAADGSWLFAGKKVTGFTNEEEHAVELAEVMPFLLETRLKEAGGEFSQAPKFQAHVVTDGKLATGQNPASAKGVARALLALLTGDERFHSSLTRDPEE